MSRDLRPLDAADSAYEQAEAAFLAALRGNADRADLGAACQVVSDAASAYNTAAYEHLHASKGDERAELDLLTERTEVLSELWADLAGAYQA